MYFFIMLQVVRKLIHVIFFPCLVYCRRELCCLSALEIGGLALLVVILEVGDFARVAYERSANFRSGMMYSCSHFLTHV